MKRLTLGETDQALILGLSGEIIMDVVPELKAAIERLAAETPKPGLVADLGQVTFMDSSGVGLLLGARRLCQSRGKAFSLRNPSPPIKKLLDMLRLTEYFTTVATHASDDRSV
jgi:anti-sigma B factor antagonist